MIFGLSPWIEIPIWFVISLAMAMSSTAMAVKKGLPPPVGAVGFFNGCALGPVAILSAFTPQTMGNRPAIAIGGIVGTLIYMSQFGLI